MGAPSHGADRAATQPGGAIAGGAPGTMRGPEAPVAGGVGADGTVSTAERGSAGSHAAGSLAADPHIAGPQAAGSQSPAADAAGLPPAQHAARPQAAEPQGASQASQQTAETPEAETTVPAGVAAGRVATATMQQAAERAVSESETTVPAGVAARRAAMAAGESPEQVADGATGQGRRKRKNPLSTPARLAAMGVAAVVLGTATVGIQAWDRSQWVAERYPEEAVQNVRGGESAERAGMRWSVQVSRAPVDSKPGRVMLQITVLLTPLEEKAIQDFVEPKIELRDTAGRTWMALSNPGDTPLRSDLRVGRTNRFVAYGVVPEELEKTAKVALVYAGADGSDVLLFNR